MTEYVFYLPKNVTGFIPSLGQRNLVATFSGKKATRFTCDAFKAISRLACPPRMWDTITPTVSSEKNVGHVELLEERAGVRASVSSNLIFGVRRSKLRRFLKEPGRCLASAWGFSGSQSWLACDSRATKAVAKVSGAENFVGSLCRNFCRIGHFSTKAATKVQNQHFRKSL